MDCLAELIVKFASVLKSILVKESLGMDIYMPAMGKPIKVRH